jgi:hypothetical protein
MLLIDCIRFRKLHLQFGFFKCLVDIVTSINIWEMFLDTDHNPIDQIYDTFEIWYHVVIKLFTKKYLSSPWVQTQIGWGGALGAQAVHQAVKKKRPKPPMLDIPFDFKITYQVNTNFPVGQTSIYSNLDNLDRSLPPG